MPSFQTVVGKAVRIVCALVLMFALSNVPTALAASSGASDAAATTGTVAAGSSIADSVDGTGATAVFASSDAVGDGNGEASISAVAVSDGTDTTDASADTTDATDTAGDASADAADATAYAADAADITDVADADATTGGCAPTAADDASAGTASASTSTGTGSTSTSTGSTSTGTDPIATPVAPVITTDNVAPLPEATTGTAYWNTATNKPLVQFAATGSPTPTFQLKTIPATELDDEVPAVRTVEADGAAYWTGAGLPKGLKLAEATGIVSGTPEVDANYTYPVVYGFTVVATNGVSPNAEKKFQLKVSKPAEPDPTPTPVYTSVPDLVGLSQGTAIRRLGNAGLVVKIDYEHADESAGTVIAQNPAAGASVESGTTVNLTVSIGPEDEPELSVLGLDLYAYNTDATGDFVSRMGDNGREEDGGIWWVPESLTQKGQRIRLCAAVQMSDGRAYYQNGLTWPDDVTVSWASSDTSVAVVSSSGVVVATGDGTATITATTSNGIRSSMNVNVIGQEGRYPVAVNICDGSGSEYGDSRITYSDVNAPSLPLYARVVFSDGTSASNAPDAFDYDPSADVFSTLGWSTSDTEKGYVNPSSGVFIPRGYASLKVYATVSGGNPSVKGGSVTGYVWIVIDSGNYADGNDPSDVLNIRITYEEDETYTAKEVSYTVDELRAVESAYATYTLTRDDGYVTASACGIYLNTLMNLLGVDVNDVHGIRLAANDGVNPGLITASFLFQPRYYLPNIEFGGNTVGATYVYPMLAYESNWKESLKGAVDSSEDYTTLDGGTCFRLLFGSLTLDDGSTAKSLKYINTLTVLLNGAPPAQPENPDPEKKDSGGGSPGLPGGSTTGQGTGTGTAQGNGTMSSRYGLTSVTDSGGSAGAEEENDNGQAGTGGQNEQPQADESGDGAEGASEFHVYQMISDAKTDMQLEDWQNPWSLWVVPLLLLCAGGGFCTRLGWFRRQKRDLRPASSPPAAPRLPQAM